MTFKYAKPRKKKPPVRQVALEARPAPTEQLTGYVMGIPAQSQGEERTFNSLRKSPLVAGIQYQFIVGTQGMPGYKTLDYLVQKVDGEYLALSLKDETFVHFGTAKLAQDLENETYTIEQLRHQQIYIDGIKTINSLDVDNQELADRTIKQLLEA